MTNPDPLIFFFDIDNTLLDNDRVTKDLACYLEKTLGKDACCRYWEIYEKLRQELGYADYLGALQRYRLEEIHDPKILKMSSYLVNYPFANRLFPQSLDAIDHVKQWGKPVVLSDGDAVFQPRKVERAGLEEAFQGNVLIYIHKEEELDNVERLYPAKHYVMIDDKIRILSAIKEIWKSRVTTVFVKQGHYAQDLENVKKYPKADYEIDTIGDLLKLSFADRL